MKKLLIVDDSLYMRTVLKNILAKLKLSYYEARNGQEAVELYPVVQPDLVTMDITMPLMGGLEAAKKILEENPHAKVMMVSAMGQHRLINEALDFGVTDFIIKPFDKDEVRKKIARELEIDVPRG